MTQTFIRPNYSKIRKTQLEKMASLLAIAYDITVWIKDHDTAAPGEPPLPRDQLHNLELRIAAAHGSVMDAGHLENDGGGAAIRAAVGMDRLVSNWSLTLTDHYTMAMACTHAALAMWEEVPLIGLSRGEVREMEQVLGELMHLDLRIDHVAQCIEQLKDVGTTKLRETADKMMRNRKLLETTTTAA